MLKIKNEIDLKELKKFGFEDDYVFGLSKIICEGRKGQKFILVITKEKCLSGYSEGADGSGMDSYLDDTLYDLIKDGLVEKVDDK